MVINLNKFGTTLVSRPAGKEASLAFNPTLREVNENEKIEVDFTGVEVLTPSWADEFLTPLFEEYGARVILQNTENPSVRATLSFLEKIKNKEDLF